MRLVEAPTVEPRRSRLFPFPAALAISAMVVAGLLVAGTFIWSQRVVLAPADSGPLVVVQSVPSEAPEEEALKPVARSSEALPPPPAAKRPVSLPVQERPPLPEPEVAVNTVLFELPESWEEAAEPFPKPEKPKVEPERKPDPKPKVAETSSRKPPTRKPAAVKRSPQVARQVPPVYPAAARRAGVEGSVLLQVAVQSNGRAGNVSLVSSSGSGLLDAAAMRAVRKWSFRPATLDGRPVSGHVRVPVRFQLR